VIDVEIINTKTTRTMFKKRVTGEGQYAEGGEANGRKIAIETVMTNIVEGVQSQW
jgi:hypothetical protein